MFSDDDIAALMTAAARLTPTLRADTYNRLIGMLAVTGMRVSEAVNLDDDDVKLDEGLIVVRHTKFDNYAERSVMSSLAGNGLIRQGDRRNRSA